MANTLKYQSNSLTCTSLVQENINNTPYNTFELHHPERGPWKIADDKQLRLLSGTTITLKKNKNEQVFQREIGACALLVGTENEAVGLNNGKVQVFPFLNPSSAFFSWILIFDDYYSVYIFNQYTNAFIGYDPNADILLSVPQGDPKIVKWRIVRSRSVKDIYKIMSLMVPGVGYDSANQTKISLDSCVIPSDVHKILGLTETCSSMLVPPNTIVELTKTKQGNISANSESMQHQVEQGLGVHPLGGCAYSSKYRSQLLTSVETCTPLIEVQRKTKLEASYQQIKGIMENISALLKEKQAIDNQIYEKHRQYSDQVAVCKSTLFNLNVMTDKANVEHTNCERKRYLYKLAKEAEEARRKAEEEARRRMEEARRLAEEKERLRAEELRRKKEEARRRLEEAQRKLEEARQKKLEELKRRRLEIEARQRAEIARCRVTLYEDCYFQGSSVTNGPGKYNMNEMGIPNDSISSIKIPENCGLSIKVYQAADFDGPRTTFTQSIPCLVNNPINRKKTWNDQISSYEIMRS